MDIRKQFWMAACAAFFVCGGTAMAQEADKDMPDRSEKHYKPVPFSPEKSARQTTNRMDSLLNLTKKQYDKLYKLNLKWVREDAENKRRHSAWATDRKGHWISGKPEASGRDCTETVRPKA